jgi:tRNA nucleotidyltransferase/poly(A) polymerase
VGTIEEDAERRDFTFNSLYVNMRTLEIIDPTGKGLEDINNRIIRFNGKMKDRIEEDYLRIFRALRFKKNFNLNWYNRKDESTFRRLFIEYANKVDPQRMLNELEKC